MKQKSLGFALKQGSFNGSNRFIVMAKINLGIVLENLESELRKSFRTVVAEDRTNAIFRAFRKEVAKQKTWYTVPNHLI